LEPNSEWNQAPGAYSEEEPEPDLDGEILGTDPVGENAIAQPASHVGTPGRSEAELGRVLTPGSIDTPVDIASWSRTGLGISED